MTEFHVPRFFPRKAAKFYNFFSVVVPLPIVTMSNEILTSRLRKELMKLDTDPPPGISCYPKEDNLTDMEAYIKGPPDSPYDNGLFKLDIQIPQNYPFDPPQIRFVTKIYHPNIDDGGRICADILKKGEKGGWKPALNIATTLMSLAQLLAHPNPDDPLDADIAREYQLDYPTFNQKAIEYTQRYANKDMPAEPEAQEDVSVTVNDRSNDEETVKNAVGSLTTMELIMEPLATNKQKSSLLSLSKRDKNSGKSLSLSKTASSQTTTKADLKSSAIDSASTDSDNQSDIARKRPSSTKGAIILSQSTTIEVGRKSSQQKNLKRRNQSVELALGMRDESSQSSIRNIDGCSSSESKESLLQRNQEESGQLRGTADLTQDENSSQVSQEVKVVIKSSQTKNKEKKPTRSITPNLSNNDNGSKDSPILLDEDDLKNNDEEPLNVKATTDENYATKAIRSADTKAAMPVQAVQHKIKCPDPEISIANGIRKTEQTTAAVDTILHSRFFNKSEPFIYSQPSISSAPDSQQSTSLSERSSSQQPALEKRRKRTFEHLENLSILPDDEENEDFVNGSNSYPVLHSLQLSKKLKRNNKLSLSRKKKS